MVGARAGHLPGHCRFASRDDPGREQPGRSRSDTDHRISGGRGGRGGGALMRSLLLVSADDNVRNRVLRIAGDYSVFSALTDDEALDTLRLTAVDLLVKD